MSENFIKKNLENLNQTNLDWNLIQTQMKNKLGVEI